MDTSVQDQVYAVRRGVGLWRRHDHTFVRFSGADAASWLQSQTTNDVEGLESGQGHANALLDRHGRLLGHFSLHRWEDEYWMLVAKDQVERVLEALDDHLFIEDAAFEDAGGALEHVVIQGPRTLGFLAALLDTPQTRASALLPSVLHGCHPIEMMGSEALAFRESLTGEDGYIFVVEQGEGEPLCERLLQEIDAFKPVSIGCDAQEVLRVEAGLPRYGVELDESVLISETPLERDSVSYEKGCYVGQEVVARLKAYGTVKRALMGLVYEGTVEPLPTSGTPLMVDGKKAGTLMSGTFSPIGGRFTSMAFLDRDHRRTDTPLEFQAGETGPTCRARVMVLPIYEATSRETRATELYEEALGRFEKDLGDEDESAIPLLREAILLHPTFEDAYEVLGVILHRHHRIDEAIHTMRALERLNPNCLMAHTNLSVFYVAKGMIDEAEEEKAKAAVLGIQQASDERKAKEMAEAERERLKTEARERIGMFEEVLDIDPDDSVATFGLGQAYIQLNEYEKAVPHLQKAAEVQKGFSAAYLNLGKCHEFLGRPIEARAAYEQGIEAASRKGDLMPLREMERRLKALESEHVSAT